MTFVYAIDDYDKDEVNEQNQWSSYIDKPTSFERVAYWLEYSNINDTPAARAHTELAFYSQMLQSQLEAAIMDVMVSGPKSVQLTC